MAGNMLIVGEEPPLTPWQRFVRLQRGARLLSRGKGFRPGIYRFKSHVVIGGLAVNRLGSNRATEDVDLRIARDLANQRLIKAALRSRPNLSIDELGEEDFAEWVIVRVSDDIVVNLMTETCGVTSEEAASGIEIENLQVEPIPFAGPELMLKLKQGNREKDVNDPVWCNI